MGPKRFKLFHPGFSSRLFCWHPSRDTLVAFAAGGLCVGLSLAMLPAKNTPWLSIIIRDFGQILLLGAFFPLAYIRLRADSFSDFGFSFRKWRLFLPINLILGAALLLMFLSESPPPEGFRFETEVLWRAAFVFCALFFELVFFYGFLRTLFERSFGIVPAIFLTALFYALHHAGFQPEYGKLLFVGLMYATVYRLGNSALLIFPFFLGVGGEYDVLIQSKAVSPILFPVARTLYLFPLLLFLVFKFSFRQRMPPGR
jgi:membrane protease YdiL (CAAX protease family)